MLSIVSLMGQKAHGSLIVKLNGTIKRTLKDVVQKLAGHRKRVSIAKVAKTILGGQPGKQKPF